MAAARRAWPFAAAAAAVGLLSGYGFWRSQGVEGLAGALIGLTAGLGIAGAAHLLRRRARSATGPKVVTAMMAATFAGFALFALLAVAVAVFYRSAAQPVLLSALGVYLAALFVDAGRL